MTSKYVSGLRSINEESIIDKKHKLNKAKLTLTPEKCIYNNYIIDPTTPDKVIPKDNVEQFCHCRNCRIIKAQIEEYEIKEKQKQKTRLPPINRPKAANYQPNYCTYHRNYHNSYCQICEDYQNHLRYYQQQTYYHQNNPQKTFRESIPLNQPLYTPHNHYHVSSLPHFHDHYYLNTKSSSLNFGQMNNQPKNQKQSNKPPINRLVPNLQNQDKSTSKPPWDSSPILRREAIINFDKDFLNISTKKANKTIPFAANLPKRKHHDHDMERIDYRPDSPNYYYYFKDEF